MSSSESEAEVAAPSKIPEKSRIKYESAYKKFDEWRQQKGYGTITDTVIIEYFNELMPEQKPSTCWATYSMLKTTIALHCNINISTFKPVLMFLKEKEKGYKPKKSRIFTKAQVHKFLQEADDDVYLAVKVALIVGVFSACQRDQLTNMLLSDVEDHGDYIKISVVERKTKIPRQSIVTEGNIPGVSLVGILKKYMSLRPAKATHNRFFVTYREGKCTSQPIGINTMGTLPQKVAKFLNLPRPERYTGHCFKRSSKTLMVEFDVPVVHLKRYGKPQNTSDDSSMINYITGNLESKMDQTDDATKELFQSAVQKVVWDQNMSRAMGDVGNNWESPLHDESFGGSTSTLVKVEPDVFKEEYDSDKDEEDSSSDEDNDNNDPLSNISNVNGEEFSIKVGKAPIYFKELNNCTIIINNKKPKKKK